VVLLITTDSLFGQLPSEGGTLGITSDQKFRNRMGMDPRANRDEGIHGQVRQVEHRLVWSFALTIIAILLTIKWFSDFGLNFIDDITVKSGIMLITNTIIITISLFIFHPEMLA
jgi:hypothetical protein